MKFNLLPQQFEGFEKFCSMQSLDASPYEHFTVVMIMKNEYCKPALQTVTQNLRDVLGTKASCRRSENEKERWS